MPNNDDDDAATTSATIQRGFEIEVFMCPMPFLLLYSCCPSNSVKTLKAKTAKST